MTKKWFTPEELKERLDEFDYMPPKRRRLLDYFAHLERAINLTEEDLKEFDKRKARRKKTQ
jgi:hypothetical protein